MIIFPGRSYLSDLSLYDGILFHQVDINTRDIPNQDNRGVRRTNVQFVVLQFYRPTILASAEGWLASLTTVVLLTLLSRWSSPPPPQPTHPQGTWFQCRKSNIKWRKTKLGIRDIGKVSSWSGDKHKNYVMDIQHLTFVFKLGFTVLKMNGFATWFQRRNNNSSWWVWDIPQNVLRFDGLVRLFHARFVGYFTPTNFDQFTIWCIETMLQIQFWVK
jgi:hypothetical protein